MSKNKFLRINSDGLPILINAMQKVAHAGELPLAKLGNHVAREQRISRGTRGCSFSDKEQTFSDIELLRVRLTMRNIWATTVPDLYMQLYWSLRRRRIRLER